MKAPDSEIGFARASFSSQWSTLHLLWGEVSVLCITTTTTTLLEVTARSSMGN